MSDSKQQKFFEIIPSGTRIAFIANRWRYITVSIVLVLASFAALAYNQATSGSILNFGIDFAGGSQVRLRFDADKDPGVDAIRSALEEAGYQSSSVVTVPGSEHEVMVRVKETLSIHDDQVEACKAAAQTVLRVDGTGTTQLLSFTHPAEGSKLFFGYDAEPNYKDLENKVNEAGCQGTADKGFGAKEGESPAEFALIGVGSKIQSEFDAKFGDGAVAEIVLSETVGAKVGGQLKEDGAKSMLYAIGFIFLFVMIRFDLRFAPGGIVALTHDAILVIGAFAITGKEFNLQTIAAILTVIGYSINDTIVVFDRIRERVALYRDEPVEKVTNDALNDTLSRTILTSGTTLLVVLATFFMGAGPIKDFAFALIIGVLVGTFSSLYIATPVFLWVNKRFYGGRGHLQALEDEDRGTGTLLSGDDAEDGVPVRADVLDATEAGGLERLEVPRRRRGADGDVRVRPPKSRAAAARHAACRMQGDLQREVSLFSFRGAVGSRAANGSARVGAARVGCGRAPGRSTQSSCGACHGAQGRLATRRSTRGRGARAACREPEGAPAGTATSVGPRCAGRRGRSPYAFADAQPASSAARDGRVSRSA